MSVRTPAAARVATTSFSRAFSSRWCRSGVRSLAAIALYRDRVELDAETGPLWQADRAVALLAERLLQELVAQPVWVLVEFEHQPVRDRGHEVQCRGEQYRARKSVRCHHQVVCLRQGGDAPT